jgi:murein DD-endopeptidase MepM/ murein hydrolase activator NlpD
MKQIPNHLPYHPVVIFPYQECQVLDLTSHHPQLPSNIWAFGRYNEKRPDTYTQDLFIEKDSKTNGSHTNENNRRNIHVGVDLFGPIYTSVHAFWHGKVIHSGYNPEPGDYGAVLVVQHDLNGMECFALYGHLSKTSITTSPVGKEIKRGDVLGWIGTPLENGGWKDPHVHFQLSWNRPETHDLPGVVSAKNLTSALEQYPDPTMIVLRTFPEIIDSSPLLRQYQKHNNNSITITNTNIELSKL